MPVNLDMQRQKWVSVTPAMWHEPDSSNKTSGSTGKAEYSERGPLSLREHGGETYWLQSEHRRSILTPHQPCMVITAYSHGQDHAEKMAEARGLSTKTFFMQQKRVLHREEFARPYSPI